MDGLWKVAFGVAGIGGVVSFVLWSLYKNWLKLDIFQQMTKEQQFSLFRLFLILTFMFALAGLGVYAYVATHGSSRTEVDKILEDNHANIKSELSKASSKTQSPVEFAQFKQSVEKQLDNIREAHKNGEDARYRDNTKGLLRYIDSDDNKKLVPDSLRQRIRDECHIPLGELKTPGKGAV